MMVEALYRDGHKEKLIVPADAYLHKVVAIAETTYQRSKVKHLRVVPHAHDNRPKR